MNFTSLSIRSLSTSTQLGIFVIAMTLALLASTRVTPALNEPANAPVQQRRDECTESSTHWFRARTIRRAITATMRMHSSNSIRRFAVCSSTTRRGPGYVARGGHHRETPAADAQRKS